MSDREITISRTDQLLIGRFRAMAGPCEVLVADAAAPGGEAAIREAAAEAWRIEAKYSRYRADSILSRLNSAPGPSEVDAETARLLDYAQRCHELSDGLFDVTSGVLRRAWTFDGSGRIPSPFQIQSLLQLIGWEKLTWRAPQLTIPAGMEIDFGGIAKEYAVDRALALAGHSVTSGVLVNFGGDLAATPRSDGMPWVVGIEATRQGDTPRSLELRSGALATSGETHRYLRHAGRRYSHILNPRTGWPATGGPATVTVHASHCTEAGMIATIAMLHGAEAPQYIDDQGYQYWLGYAGN